MPGFPRDLALERRVINTYRQLKSCQRTGDRLGVSKQRAHFILKRAGVL